MKLHYLGQNCFLIEYKDRTIITDPFYNNGAEQSKFDIKNTKIDYILITHAHQDHVNDVNEVLKFHPKATIIAQPEICGYYNHQHCVDINFGGSTYVEDLKITMVPALHTSSFNNGKYGGQPAGYIMKTKEYSSSIYMAGDTGILADMAYFTKVYGAIGTAILPIGGHYTMDAKQAAWVAKEWLNCKNVIGCHFDTFEPILINHEEAIKEFNEQGIEVLLPELGQEIEF